ncbi:DUF6578 domain-containing protein [Streptomyces sp. NPDC015171]|uniref:DUF6578 domain-containing protein n=1 Tax=Streptomyces sp. NPDC015171 TaxID=3364945 RepID=UPI0037004400
MTRTRVFYADWQMECCGTPFAVGDEVRWPLVAADREDPAGEHYGAGALVEHHGGPGHETAGRVRGIDLVHQEYLAHHDPLADEPPAPLPGTGVVLRATGRRLAPVPGGHGLRSVDACPKWFDAHDHEEPPPRRVPYRVRRAVGVLVTLDVLDAADEGAADDDGADDGAADSTDLPAVPDAPDGTPPRPRHPR